MIFSAVFTVLCRRLRSLTVVFLYHTVRQGALHNTAVEVVEDLSRHAKLPQSPQEVQPLLYFLNRLGGVECPGEVLTDADPQMFKTTHALYFKLSDKQWLISSPLFPHIYYHLVRVEGKVVVLTPCYKTGHLPPVGCFIPPVMSPITLVSLANFKMTLSLCEQCVEDGTENTPLWGAKVCCDSG